ncbi:MAG: DUF4959 domain-containing protein [Bacteroidales bacterium]|jgi:hypothetical protein|nr:DUF4959 domain-containing protein [Bacteroidales bacterium]
MKILLNILFPVVLLSLLITGCDDDSDKITPSDISAITSYPLPGKVVLKWQVPADSALDHVRISYHDPIKQGTIHKTVSRYNDTITIDGLLQKHGPVTFSLQSISETGTGGTSHTVSQEPQRATITYYVEDEEPINLTIGQIFTNNTPSGHGVAGMLDGDLSTIYQSQWNPAVDLPHVLDIFLDEEVQTIKFKYTNRNDNTNGKPEIIDVMTSSDGLEWTFFETIGSGLPSAVGASYESKFFMIINPTRYIRLSISKCYNNDQFFSMAEFGLIKGDLGVVDPEK